MKNTIFEVSLYGTYNDNDCSYYMLKSVSVFQTDIVAVRTPQTEGYPFLTPRLTQTDLDTSDSDHTRQDGAASPTNKMTITPPSRARSPRPQSLPGLGGDGIGFLAKRGPPPGSSIPGMAPGQEIVSPPGPVVVKSFARNLVEGLLCETGREVIEFLSRSFVSLFGGIMHQAFFIFFC